MNYLKRHARLVGLLVLAVLTAYGLYQFVRGDWHAALGYWHGRGLVFLLALGLQAADILLDSFLWAVVLREFGIRIAFRTRALVFMSGYAGLLLPLQLGRYLRSEAIGRLGLGSAREAVKAETVFLALTAAANVAVLGSVAASRVHWTLAVFAPVLFLSGFLLSATWAFRFVAARLDRPPPALWRRPWVVAVAFLAMIGWYVNGLLLFLLTMHLPGAPALWQAAFIAPANLLLGVLSGLPGGIGAVEGALGLSLSMLRFPEEQLALSIAAFRLVTFWLWIPVGWLALTRLNRISTPDNTPRPAPEQPGA